MPPVRVLFVCLGNICRSPSAEGVFLNAVAAENLSNKIHIDSAGTGDWHIGLPPDTRAIAAASKRGIDLSGLRARLVSALDFTEFDYILAMDKANLHNLQRMQPENFSGHLGLFLDFIAQGKTQEVPDPYYGGDDGFNHVLDLIEQASVGLLQEIKTLHLECKHLEHKKDE